MGDTELSKSLGIQSDAYPEKAPTSAKPKSPLVMSLEAPLNMPPFKLPSGDGGGIGTGPKPIPVEGRKDPGEKPSATGAGGGLPMIPKDTKAPKMPEAHPFGVESQSVGTGIKTKPVPGSEWGV